MKVALSTTAALVLLTVPMLAQETGVSHPDPTPITADAPDQPAPKPKPSAAISADSDVVTSVPAPPAQNDTTVYQPYHPSSSTLAARTAPPVDVDAEIVTSVPTHPGEVPEGTLIKVRMNNALSTQSTLRGAEFTATVSDDVQNNGKVVIPTGSTLNGVVTEVHGGRRISGRAAIHLEPQRIVLPDGTYYPLHAQVIDTSENNDVRVDREGTIVRRDHAKETLAVVGATTGAAAVAGAMLAGGVGAAVGAGIGAGASTVLWLKQDRQTALPRDTQLIFSLTTPLMTHPLQDGAQVGH